MIFMSYNTPAKERSPLLGSDDARGITYTDTGTDSQPSHHAEHNEAIVSERDVQYTGNTEVRKQLKWITPAVSLGVFLAAADQTIVVSSYGKIGSELESLNLASWIATAYLLSLTSCQPLYGKLSDIFGRKACLIFAYTIFGLGGLFCGLAQTMEQLVVARLFQGIGGGGMTVVVSILFSDIVPLKERGLWQGIINIISATGALCGAPIGGFCADYIGWRWAFLTQAPISLLAILAVTVVLKLPPLPKQDWRSKLKRIDFLGAGTLVLAVFAFSFGMDRGSNLSWKTPLAYGPLVASVFLFLAFFYVEARVASEPFAPGHVIFTRNMAAAYSAYFFGFAGWLSLLFYLPLYFQVLDGVSSNGAGVRLIPFIITNVLASLGGGLLIKKTERYYWLTVAAYFTLMIGIIPIFLFSGVVAASLTGILVGTVIVGIGNGIGVTSALIALIADARPADQAIATACSYLFRGVGSTIGLSLSATLVQSILRSNLRRELGRGGKADEIERNVRRSLDYLNTLEPETREIVKHAYGVAVRHCYVLVFVLCAGAFISSLFIKERRLSKQVTSSADQEDGV